LGAPRIITTIEEAIEGIDAVFCDVWGVLHNGVAAFREASLALERIRKARPIAVVLLSNAPRPSSHVLPQLARLGVRRTAFDAMATSGDLCRTIIAGRKPQRFLHLGPARDGGLFEGLGLEPADEADADYILCTGLYEDTTETPEDYRATFDRLLARRLPMLCANPDLVIDRGGTTIYCAGALAELYAAMGGETEVIGKPYGAVYGEAQRIAEGILGRPTRPESILAIGDSLRTDIAGAAAFGATSLLVARGIHAADLLGDGSALDGTLVRRFLADAGASPDFVIDALR
jgi:HAD superfamily hydrolase (TIGR01459 family)